MGTTQGSEQVVRVTLEISPWLLHRCTDCERGSKGLLVFAYDFVPDLCACSAIQSRAQGKDGYRIIRSSLLLLCCEAARWLAKSLTTANLLDRLAACEENCAQKRAGR